MARRQSFQMKTVKRNVEGRAIRVRPEDKADYEERLKAREQDGEPRVPVGVKRRKPGEVQDKGRQAG